MTDFKKLLTAAKRDFKNHPTDERQSGFTNIKCNDKFAVISHGGNMGNTIKHVNENLHRLNKLEVEFLKEKAIKWVEDGSPDYMYTLVLKFK